MNEFQKIVKYCAMAFAAFLAFTILTGIITAIFALTGAINVTSSKNVVSVDKSFEEVKSLSIDHGVGNFIIKNGTGNQVQVIAENVSEDFVVKKSFSGELSIKNKFNFWSFLSGQNSFGEKSKVTIYIPTDFVAEKVKIDAGAGNVTIDSLTAKKIEINAGAGNINGNNITADKVKLDGGVGEITFEDVKFTDADIDSGVGNITLEGSLYGRNEIECGVGNVSLELNGSTDDYKLKVEKGLGSVSVDGKKYSDLNWDNMTADNILDIDGGVGNIDIDFKE